MPVYTRREVRISAILEWIWIIVLFLIAGLALLPSVAVVRYGIETWPPLLTACAIPPALFVSFACYVTLAGLLARTLPPVKEGTFQIGASDATLRWMLRYGMNNYLRVFGFQRVVHSNPLLRRLYVTLFGAAIDRGVKMSYETDILDPSLLEIGEGTKVGAFTIIAGHYSDETSFIIARVHIGKNVLIGGGTLIGPGVRIGDNAVIEARSGVLPGTTIAAGEVWGGSPARCKRRQEREVSR